MKNSLAIALSLSLALVSVPALGVIARLHNEENP